MTETMQNDAIDKLLDATPELWKGRCPNGARRTLPSGHARLDERLPGGGWPVGALTEIITPHPGLGELSLLLPALALSLIHISEPTRQVLVSRMPSSA